MVFSRASICVETVLGALFERVPVVMLYEVALVALMPLDCLAVTLVWDIDY